MYTCRWCGRQLKLCNNFLHLLSLHLRWFHFGLLHCEKDSQTKGYGRHKVSGGNHVGRKHWELVLRSEGAKTSAYEHPCNDCRRVYLLNIQHEQRHQNSISINSYTNTRILRINECSITFAINKSCLDLTARYFVAMWTNCPGFIIISSAASTTNYHLWTMCRKLTDRCKLATIFLLTSRWSFGIIPLEFTPLLLSKPGQGLRALQSICL